MNRKRVALGIAIVLVIAAIPFVIAQISPPMQIPGAKLRRATGAASIYMFEKPQTAKSVADSFAAQGWVGDVDAAGKMDIPPDSFKTWILTFFREQERMTVYGWAELTDGPKSETGTVSLVWHKPPLPEFFYIIKSYFSPEITINLSPTIPPP